MTLHLLKASSKPSKQRQHRKKYAAVDYATFAGQRKEEEKKGKADHQMIDSTQKDGNNMMRTNNRNKAPTQFN